MRGAKVVQSIQHSSIGKIAYQIQINDGKIFPQEEDNRVGSIEETKKGALEPPRGKNVNKRFSIRWKKWAGGGNRFLC